MQMAVQFQLYISETWRPISGLPELSTNREPEGWTEENIEKLGSKWFQGKKLEKTNASARLRGGASVC